MQRKVMDFTHEAHRKQYETTDFDYWRQRTDLGLIPLEEYFVDRYLAPDNPTLEIGSGTGRIAFALERRKQSEDIVAIDVVDKFIEFAKENAGLID